jgi:FeS assembly SUF system regulator
MIRMARLTDYGILVLQHFAAGWGARPKLSARDIALETQIPLPTVSKLLKLLTKRGLLVSHRGVNGGYGLSRPPEKITIAEIIDVLEGPIAVTDCNVAAGSCDKESTCPTRPHWQLINGTIHEALSRVALSRMVSGNPPLPVWTGKGRGA